MGIEVSRDLASEAKKRTECIGGKIAFSNALDGVKALDSCSIHLAILCSFLEHESQPLLFLKQLYRTLTPNGEVLIKVPNFSSWNRKIRNRSWSGFRFPDHVNYFTPETLKRLAQQAGFHGFRQRMIDRLPFSDNMYAVLEKAP
jgi:predicted SAM-dependent methyltransferase